MIIRWTTLAAKDFAHICDYTEASFGVAQASDTAKAIYGSADSLQNMPNRGRRGRRANTRELDVPALPFVIVYRVVDDAVEILRILHDAQMWP
jgi:toxin ParE1/3/4